MFKLISNSFEDTLIDGLSFKLGKTTPYITNRRSCIFRPQGSNIYSSNAGVKLVKTNKKRTDSLDPSLFRIRFDLVNTDLAATHKLRPIGGP